jgi:hypothetical protein
MLQKFVSPDPFCLHCLHQQSINFFHFLGYKPWADEQLTIGSLPLWCWIQLNTHRTHERHRSERLARLLFFADPRWKVISPLTEKVKKWLGWHHSRVDVLKLNLLGLCLHKILKMIYIWLLLLHSHWHVSPWGLHACSMWCHLPAIVSFFHRFCGHCACRGRLCKGNRWCLVPCLGFTLFWEATKAASLANWHTIRNSWKSNMPLREMIVVACMHDRAWCSRSFSASAVGLSLSSAWALNRWSIACFSECMNVGKVVCLLTVIALKS